MTTLDDLRDQLADGDARTRWVGVWIGALAVLLAVGGWAGGNAALDVQRINVDVANTWAWYQAKHGRKHALDVQIEAAETRLAAETMTEDARRAWDARIDEWRAFSKTIAVGREGMDELTAKARALEAERDRALRQDTVLGWANAVLQIAVVLASVAVVMGATWPLSLSALASALGTAMLVMGIAGA